MYTREAVWLTCNIALVKFLTLIYCFLLGMQLNSELHHRKKKMEQCVFIRPTNLDM